MSEKTTFPIQCARPGLIAAATGVLTAVFFLAPRGFAAEGAAVSGPDPDRILAVARNSYAIQNYDLEGSLRKKKEWRETGFRLSMRDGMIWFKFSEPDQTIQLEFKDNGYILREVVPGRNALVAPSRYADAVRGTDVSYEDLSMRFLYWPRAKFLGVEKFKVYQCWKVAVKNPDGFGPYDSVLLWVDQGSGGLVKMIGFDAEGRTVRRFMVSKVQQIRGTWMLEEMRVERYDIASGKVAGMTYLKIKDPDKKTTAPGRKG